MTTQSSGRLRTAIGSIAASLITERPGLLRRRCVATTLFVAPLLVLIFFSTPVRATKVILKDGRELDGGLVPLRSLIEQPQAGSDDGAPSPRLILMVDDDLRRTYVPKIPVPEIREGDSGEVLEKITLWQKPRRTGLRVNNVGQILKVTPFDEFGRRTTTIHTDRGAQEIHQGITEITPSWTKVEGLSHVWEERIATSSIPRETLDKMLDRVIDPKNIDQRRRVARLYLQGERYVEARKVLEQLMADFEGQREEVEPLLNLLRQLGARRVLTELRVRRAAGQHQLVLSSLESFPAEGIAGEILQAVGEMQESYRQDRNDGEHTLSLIDEHLSALADADMAEKTKEVRDEIQDEVNYNTLDRLAVYRRLSTDETLSAEVKLALAVSSWVVGSDGATENLAVALSIWRLRNLIREFLREPQGLKRDRLLEEIQTQEGATPAIVARILRLMRPPMDLPEEEPGQPGLYRLSVAGYEEEPEFEYLIQLPPEYDPYRHYPTVVTLHASATTPEHQIDWWAGGRDSTGARRGQATRYGYIVIAPFWGKQGQSSYEYTARAHAAVLNSLRDACRRFSVDTDRVFLSGHAMGGAAAWDIGLAHPDLWAGVIPLVAVTDRYCNLYYKNARYVPFYVVQGELDGDTFARNAPYLDRYFRGGFPITVVEYRGRGHEHFSDEIQRIFDWMERYRRDFFPAEFECRTMRSWDNFFWWAEMADFPDKGIVPPHAWPPTRGTRWIEIEGKRLANNGLRVSTGAGRVTLWLTPDIIDFDQRVNLIVNGARLNTPQSEIQPSLRVMLDDVRTRGDRQHPFWANVQMPTGRVNQVAKR